MTDLLAPPESPPPAPHHEVVTLANLRAISRGRSLGLGVTALVLAFIQIAYFGLGAGSLETTIELGYGSATSLPNLSTVMRVVVAIIGAAALAGGIVLVVRVKKRPLGVFAIVAGVLLVAWVVLLLCHVNGADGTLKTLTVPVRGVAYLLGGLCAAGGAFLVVTRSSRWAFPIFFGSTALFILTFLVWIARGSNTGVVLPLTLTGVLAASFFNAVPLMYGSLAGVMCERAGVVNIAIEGQFMFGALSACMVASIIGANTVGFVAGTAAAAVIGGLLGSLLAYMALHFRANQIIVGVVIVAACTAMVQFMVSQVLVSHESLNQNIGTLPIAIPGLSKIPIIGPIFFDQRYFVYLAVVLVALVSFLMFRTRWGLRLRSVGEKPKASETVGLSVIRIRYVAVITAGLVAGIGGAVFTIGEGIQMGVGITGGQGFIALAIMIFGRWRPWSAFAATMLFGVTFAINSDIQVYLSQVVVPQQLIQALPYLITIAAVAGLVGKVRPPAADGIPYVRE